MVSKAVQEATEETRMELTPMIDVTFLLLIFFLCSIKFKVLEGKLETFLPKEAGVNTWECSLLEKVDVRITRVGASTFDALGLADLDRFRAWKDRGWTAAEIGLTVNGRKVADLTELGGLLDELRRAVPAPGDPNGPDDVLGTADDESDPLKLNIEAMRGVLYEDVVKVVDVAIASKFTAITFRGIEGDA